MFTQKKSTVAVSTPPSTQHIVFRFLRFLPAFSRNFLTSTSMTNVSPGTTGLRNFTFFLRKKNNKKTSQDIHPGPLGHVFVWLVVIDVYVKTAHHLYSFLFLFFITWLKPMLRSVFVVQFHSVLMLTT